MNDKDYFYNEYDEIISSIYCKKTKDLTIEKMSETIMHLDKAIEAERTKRILVEYGSKKVIKEMRHYLNKVYFRDHQLEEMKKIFKTMLSLSFKSVKLIPKKNNMKRKSLLKRLKKLKQKRNEVIEFLKENDIEEVN